MHMQVPRERPQIRVSKWKGPSAGEQRLRFLERSLPGPSFLETGREQGHDQKQGRALDAA